LAFVSCVSQVFKQKVLELGEKLLPAFNTPTGIPRGVINLGRNPAGANNNAERSLVRKIKPGLNSKNILSNHIVRSRGVQNLPPACGLLTCLL
ncbi:mannosyl-oligosaccharide 1,2-alpha-mannosidase IA isoform X1, partial [Tachysurus ichikawai]